MTAYANIAAVTNIIQEVIQIASNVGEFEGGCIPVIVANIVTRTNNNVINSAILPGIISGGIRKLIHETTTNMRLGK